MTLGRPTRGRRQFRPTGRTPARRPASRGRRREPQKDLFQKRPDLTQALSAPTQSGAGGFFPLLGQPQNIGTQQTGFQTQIGQTLGNRLGLSSSQFQARVGGSALTRSTRQPGGIISPFERPIAFSFQRSRLRGTDPFRDLLSAAVSNERVRRFRASGIDIP